MTLFLSSSPCLYQVAPATLNAANGFVARLKAALPKNPKTLFVCSDADSFDLTDNFAKDMILAFRDAGIPFGTAAVLDHRNHVYAKELIARADLIILMGGHVPTQNAFMQEIDLKELIAGFDGVILGVSAGSMNAAAEVYAQPEAPGESRPSFQRFYKGLGLTDVNICPHYQQVRDWELDGKRLFEDITYADSMGHTFYVFPDGTYLYRDEREYAILGECWRIRNGILEKLAEDGGRIDLK